MLKPETPSRDTARNTSSSTSKTTRKKQTNGGLQDVLQRRKHEVIGLAIMFVSFLLLISIFSYSPEDNSKIENISIFDFFSEYATLAADQLKNPLGLIGAKLSGFIMESILGYPTALLVGVAAFWGWTLFRRQKHEHAVSVTVYATLFAVQIAAMFGATNWEISEAMSGAIGRLIATFLRTIIGDFGTWSILLILLFVTIVLMIDLDIQKTLDRITYLFRDKAAGASTKFKEWHESRESARGKKTTAKPEPTQAKQNASQTPNESLPESSDDTNALAATTPDAPLTQSPQRNTDATSVADDDDDALFEHLNKRVSSYVEFLPSEKKEGNAQPAARQQETRQPNLTKGQLKKSPDATDLQPSNRTQKEKAGQPDDSHLRITVHPGSGAKEETFLLSELEKLEKEALHGDAPKEKTMPSQSGFSKEASHSHEPKTEELLQKRETTKAPEQIASKKPADAFSPSASLKEEIKQPKPFEPPVQPKLNTTFPPETTQKNRSFDELSDEETIDELISPYTRSLSKAQPEEPDFTSRENEPLTPENDEETELPTVTTNPPFVEETPSSLETNLQKSAAQEEMARAETTPGIENTQAEEEAVEITVKETVREEAANLDDRDLKVDTRHHVAYRFPSVDLLNDPENEENTVSREELEENKAKLLEKLRIYKIEVIKIEATVGPRVTLFELELAPDVKVSRIVALQDDLAMALAARGIRIIAPIPGKNAVGVEIPNNQPQMVHIKTVLQSQKFKNSKCTLPIAFGKTISNEIFIDDLAKMPHLLIAGATGSGKSVGINTLLASLIYFCSPDNVKFLLIDPKRVELFPYHQLKNHFLVKYPELEEQIITDTSKAVYALKSIEKEMDNRYDRLAKAGVRNIKAYNEKFSDEALPYIVVVIDELADMMITAGKEVEEPIARLAQLARAVGIHLVVATQRPSVDVITGIIKANFPARVAYQVTSKVDSRTILDMMGADQLLGNGDMLYLPSTEPKPIRIQNAFISTSEVERLTDFIYSQKGFSAYYELPLPEIKGTSSRGRFDEDISAAKDKMFEDAARLVVRHQQGSVSLLQRRLKLGFSRAARIMDQLEQSGIVGPQDGSKARVVLIETEDSLDLLLNNLD
ncbi:cell divisionFtsK/SpoIIIE [Chloroherpeton thalassium ATCC 35110]|uniref:Cell divisionFtsK/SpoIIIE n=1 Tax=Chloroherpeton thalassium (strain ATCC 35110 / GB-78) TaxID=517418 RepID=B3QV26_CHLT3|nr:DNA translocase FtsK 4TM domain-containing protein [Chloroherpeton thalassium]ACF12980.1 cell divisionFtsK/SpoIIIE [Chloroherpeton thalassium ATCC 35110]